MSDSFKSFDLDERLMRAIEEMGFEEPTPVQEATIPAVLDGADMMAQAQTGTGKTAAFGIPIIELVEGEPGPSALILVPTRELAIQVSAEIQRLSKYMKVSSMPIYGGQSINLQFDRLKQGVDIIAGTPGRVMDHMRRGTLDLSKVQFAVLDEADRMLDMGFIEDIQYIMSRIPEDRQTLIYSATLPHKVRELAEQYMQDPEEVMIGEEELVLDLTKQIYFNVGRRNKMWALCRVIDTYDPKAIIFCQTKRMVDLLEEKLRSYDYKAEAIHGDLSQARREKVLKNFRSGRSKLLIATDVAARGLDIEDVTMVFNYDIPDDPEVYVHRIGRTGRAGKEGTAITFVTSQEQHLLRNIEQYSGLEIEEAKVPEAKGRDTVRRVIDWAEASDIYGMVTFDINLGKEDGFTKNGLIDFLIREVRVNPFAVGEVNLGENASTVQIHNEYGSRTLKALGRKKYSGKTIRVQVRHKTRD